MSKKKIISSILATGITLSSMPVEAAAQSPVDVNNNEIIAASADNGGINDVELYLSKTGETDTSIAVSWTSVENAASYSVIVNNEAIAEDVSTTTYNISGLESASEYFVVVGAYDESGKMLLESNELCAHTSLTLTSNYTLTKDISAANVYLNGGTFDLNGHSLTVDGDVWLSGGYLNVNKGKLYIGGDFNLKRTNYSYGEGYLTMQNAEDYILVNGNMFVNPFYCYSTLTAGTIEIKGNFTQQYARDYYQHNFSCGGSHKVVLSGEKLQTVSFASTQSQFNILDVQNFSEEGVVFTTAATVVELLDNGCNVSFANGERSGWTLEKDETIDGDLNLSRGTLDLNGHKLTVTGNMVQSGGNVLVNGGELDVQGDYRVQALNGGNYTTSPGTLTMKNDSDTVRIGGDFIMQSTRSHSELLSAGTLEIAGNLTQLSGGAGNNFYTTGTHTVVLNGLDKQTVSIANSEKNNSRIANLKIENTSAEGVNIASRVYILGKLYNTDSVVTGSSNLHITATTEFPDGRWNYDANFVENRTVPANLSFGGSVYINASLTLASDTSVDNDLNINSNLNLNSYTLTVDGDVWLSGGYLNVNKGKLYIGGDFNLKRTNYSYGEGYLTMQNAEDYILVNGNMFVNPFYCYSTLTAGTIEIKGNFTQQYARDYYQHNFSCGGSHKVVLSGEKLQTVSFASTQSQFNILEITKPFDVGYVFSDNAQWNELVENYMDDSAPAAPTSLQFVRSTSTSVMMRWTGSTDSGKLNRYEIYRDGKLVGTTKQTEFIDNGLNTHTQYEYYIVALGANGVRSENSNTIMAATDVDAYAPTTPTGLQAVIRADGTVYLTWIASSDNVSVDGYNLYRNGEFIGNTAGTAYNDKNAEPGYHEYYVEAFDNEGNNSLFSSSVYADNMPPQKPVLHISEITPMRITFKWNSEDNVEIDHFEIYKNGEFFRNTKSSEYTDTAVTAGDEYSYYVVAIDTSGNVSEASDAKKISAKNDEEKPQIGIAAQTLTETNKSLKIVCTDDVMLSELNAEIKASSSDEWRSVKTQTLSQKSQIVNLDLSNYLTDSGEYNIRISVADAAGNTETVESKFTYAKNEMSEFEVTAVADGCSVRLEWTSASDSSDIRYEIRRSGHGETNKFIAVTSNLSCVDSGLYPMESYVYTVIARDPNQYSVSGNEVNVIAGKDTIAPIAKAKSVDITIAGQTVKFDGSGSTDNNEIKKYSWDFGDSSTGEGKTVSHVYAKEGKYTVSLTVTDESGNAATDTAIVTVYGTDYSISEIQITNESGKPLPNTWAYYEADGSKTILRGDNDGLITCVAKAGTYDISFYADGCLPETKLVTLDGIHTGSDKLTISLTEKELVSVTCKAEELPIEKIVELGIPLDDAANRYIYRVDMTIKNGNPEGDGSADLKHYDICVIDDGNIIVESDKGFYVTDKVKTTSTQKTVHGTSNTTLTITTLSTLLKTDNLGTNEKVFEEGINKFASKALVSVSVTEYSWLKGFYEIKVDFINNASEGFDVNNCTIALNLSDGLSLVKNDKYDSGERVIEKIEGGKTKSVTWCVRGETAGDHDFDVKLTGTLTPFGVTIEGTGSGTVDVKDKEYRELKITPNTVESSKFTLTNTAETGGNESVLYDVRVDLAEIVLENENTDKSNNVKHNDIDYVIAKYPSGLIELLTWANSEKTEVTRTIYLPVNASSCNNDDEVAKFRTLQPGEYIEGIIHYEYREDNGDSSEEEE